LVASTSANTAASPVAKKRLGVPGVVGIVLGVSLLGILVVSSLDQAGKACSDEGSLVAAVACFETMTSIESVLGVRSVRLANAYTDLSLCYSRQTRLADAMRAQEKAIALQKELNGADSPIVLVLTANLGTYKSKAKDYAAAERILNETLEFAQQRTPPNTYCVGFALNALVDCYLAQQKYDAAEAAAKRLANVDDILTSTGFYPFYGKESLAEIYAKTGKVNEAESEARAALIRPINSDKAVAVPAHEALAKVLVLKGDKDQAKREFDTAMALLTAKFGECEKTQYWRARYAHYLQEKDPFKE
jgi:tetratricopeptide (TPR) repeat protein